MQSSRDSSLWRSLAVAFGDGLAFGVGMKLTQAAGRQVSAPADAAPPEDPTPAFDERSPNLEPASIAVVEQTIETKTETTIYIDSSSIRA